MRVERHWAVPLTLVKVRFHVVCATGSGPRRHPVWGRQEGSGPGRWPSPGTGRQQWVRPGVHVSGSESRPETPAPPALPRSPSLTPKSPGLKAPGWGRQEALAREE